MLLQLLVHEQDSGVYCIIPITAIEYSVGVFSTYMIQNAVVERDVYFYMIRMVAYS